MKLEQHNGLYLIIQSPYELFWKRWAVPVVEVGKNRPQLKDVIKDWWDATAPGEWTTTYVNNTSKRAIVIRDPKLFMLFKLAWTNSPVIESAIRVL